MNPSQAMSNEEACKQLEDLENQLKESRAKLAQRKQELFRIENVADYQFAIPGNETISLSALFGTKSDLIVIHNMGQRCSYCTLWADGFNGVLNHLENRAAFVVSSPDSPEVQSNFAKSRNWKFQMVSTSSTTFLEDMGMSGEKGSSWPGMSLFHKSGDGKITRVAKDFFGPGDDYSAPWHMFSLLKEGTHNWGPKLVY